MQDQKNRKTCLSQRAPQSRLHTAWGTLLGCEAALPSVHGPPAGLLLDWSDHTATDWHDSATQYRSRDVARVPPRPPRHAYRRLRFSFFGFSDEFRSLWWSHCCWGFFALNCPPPSPPLVAACMHMHRDRPKDGRTDRHTPGSCRQTDRQTGRQTDRTKDMEVEIRGAKCGMCHTWVLAFANSCIGRLPMFSSMPMLNVPILFTLRLWHSFCSISYTHVYCNCAIPKASASIPSLAQ